MRNLDVVYEKEFVDTDGNSKTDMLIAYFF